MKILGIGESVIDQTYITPDTTVPEGVVPSTNAGGPVLIAMILLARLEHQCTFITTLGRDDEAKIIRKTLHQENVDVYGDLKNTTKINPILVNPTTGKRTKLRGNTVHPSLKNLEKNVIQEFDIIIIDRHHNEAFYDVVKHKKPSAKIIIDPSTEVSPYTFDMIRHADYPIIPIETLANLNDENLETSLIQMYEIAEKPFVVTLGELGSILYDGNTMKLIPALEIDTVDTTGAGDIYRGAFAYGITQDWKLEKCIEYANCVAAMHCTRMGNAKAIPTKAEIELCRHLSLSKKSLTKPVINQYFNRLP